MSKQASLNFLQGGQMRLTTSGFPQPEAVAPDQIRFGCDAGSRKHPDGGRW